MKTNELIDFSTCHPLVGVWAVLTPTALKVECAKLGCESTVAVLPFKTSIQDFERCAGCGRVLSRHALADSVS